MIDFIGFIATLAAGMLIGIPCGIFAWKLGCAMGGYKSEEKWGGK